MAEITYLEAIREALFEESEINCFIFAAAIAACAAR